MERLQKPSESDCCGSGCTPCVFDVYEELFKTHKVSTPVGKIRHDLLSPLKYKAYKLLDICKVNDYANIYTFIPEQVPDCSDANAIIEGILPYEPGQHFIAINAKLDDVKGKATFSRSYTPISLSQKQNNCRVKFLIKLYKDGAMSSYISQLKLNDVMYFRGAFGDFRHVANSKYMMICAGTGFAPMYAIIKAILDDEKDETLIRLLFACSSTRDIYFREEIREFGKFWNFTSAVYVSEELGQHEVRHDENIHAIRISEEAITNEISDRINYKVLICGSASFNVDMTRYAEQCGIPEGNLFVF